jgi:ComF family protein
MMALKPSDLAGALRRLSCLAVDLILPPTCPGCGSAIADSDALCARCWPAVRFIEPPLCPVYGTPFAHDLGANMVSAEALADPPPFRRARSAAVYGDVARRMVHQLKYHDRPHVAEAMATAMLRAGRQLIAPNVVLVPVPLYRWRLWRRQFNQAALLATALGRLCGMAPDPLVLERVKATGSQVGLTLTQRQANVSGAFRVPEAMRGRIAGREVILVDDVYTSGSTAKAATRALLRGGAAAVDVLTFARVLSLLSPERPPGADLAEMPESLI